MSQASQIERPIPAAAANTLEPLPMGAEPTRLPCQTRPYRGLSVPLFGSSPMKQLIEEPIIDRRSAAGIGPPSAGEKGGSRAEEAELHRETRSPALVAEGRGRPPRGTDDARRRATSESR
jgi:hypothetical protein